MKNKRLFLSLFALVLLVALSAVSLTACSTNKDSSGNDATFTVTFMDGGNVLTTRKTGQTVTVYYTPEKEGYVFDGWYTDEDLTVKADSSFTAKDNVTLYAKWNAAVFTVTFTGADGETLSSASVRYGEAATAPTSPEKDGYTFAGWDTSFDSVKGNLTVTAKFNPIVPVLTVLFDGETVLSRSVTAGEDISTLLNTAQLDLTVPSGFEFDFWSISENGNARDSAPDAMPVVDTEVYAVLKLAELQSSDLVLSAPVTMVFGGELPALSAYVAADSDNGANGITYSYSWEIDGRTANADGNSFTPDTLNAGTHTVKAVLTASSGTMQTVSVSKTTSVTVTKATITGVTSSAAPVTYDGAQHTLSVDGTVNGDAVAYALSSDGEYVSTKPTFNQSGTHTVYYKVSRPNYFDYVSSQTVVINKANLTVTAENKSAKYGAALPGFEYSVSGFAATDDESVLSGTAAFNCDAVNTLTVGNFDVSISGLSAVNYTITYQKGILIINKAALTVKAENCQTVYGSAAPEFTVTYEGFASGETENVLNGEITFNCSYAQGDSVGAYAVTPSGVSATNYDVTFVGSTLTVNKLSVTLTAENATAVYGDPAPTFHANSVGTYGEDVLNYSFVCLYTQGSSVDSYSVEVTAETDDNPNYDVTFVNAELTVGKRAATVTAENKSVTYGDSIPEYTALDTNVLDGDTLDFTLDCSYAAGSGVTADGYSISVSLGSNPNYSVTTVGAKLTVNKRTATVTAENKSVTYGNAAPEYTATDTNVLDGDALNFTLDCSYAAGSGVTSDGYSISVSIGSNPNYSLTAVGATLTVNKRAAIVTADDKTAIYGNAAPEFTYKVEGLYSSDILNDVTLSSTYAAGAAADDYDVTVTVGDNANYTVATTNGVLSVAKRTLNIVLSEDKAYNGEVWSSSALSASNLYGSDTLVGTLSTMSAEIGEYDCNGETLNGFEWSGLDVKLGEVSVLANYNVTYDVSVSIVFVEIAYSSSNFNGVYDAAAHGAFVTGTAAGVTVSYSADNITFGTYAVSFTDAGNHTVYFKLEQDGKSPTFGQLSVKISPAPLTVTADDKSSTYGDSAPAFTVSVNGLYARDGLTFSAVCPTADKNAGTYAIKAQGEANDNYTFTLNNGTYTVNRKALTVTANDKAVAYGDAAPAFSALITGFVSGDSVSDLSGAPAYTCQYIVGNPVGSTKTINVSGYTSDNYAISFASGTLTIIKRAITLTAENKTSVYGSAAPAFSADSDGFVCGDDNTVVGGLTFDCDYAVGNGVGSYAVTILSATADNYAFAFSVGSLNVTARPSVLTIDSKNITFGDDAPEYTASANNLFGGDALVYSLVCAYAKDDNAGGYAITANVGVNANYSVSTVDGALSVGRKSVSVVWNGTDGTYTYNGSDQSAAITATFEGGNAAIAFSGTATTFKNAGSYTLTASTTSVNYTLTNVTKTASIGKATYSGIASPSFTGVYNPSYTLNANYALSGGYTWNSPSTVPTVAVTAYAVTYNADSANYFNYSLNATVTLTKAIATIGGTTVQAYDYDGTAKALDTSSSSINAVYNGTALNVTYTFSTSTNSFTAGGTYRVNVTLNADNYAFASAAACYVKVKSVTVGSTLYTIEDAFNTAVSGNTITVTNDAAFAVGDNAGCYSGTAYYTLKSGVTLILPSSADSSTTIGTPTYGAGLKASYVDLLSGYLEQTLTIPQNVTCSVYGTILIQGLLGVEGGIYEGHTSGKYSQIVNNGNVVLYSGGILDCRGYIKGTGDVVFNGGSKIYSPFVVRDFRGGTDTVVAYKEGGISPFSQYEMPNIQCGYTLHYNAIYTAYMDLYANSSHNTTSLVIIGTTSGLLKLSSGAYLIKEYDRTNTKTTLTLVGNITLGDMTLKISVGSASLSTVNFPIPWTYNIVIGDGTTSTTVTAGNLYKLMTGSSLTVSENATLNLSGKLIVYSSFTDTAFGGVAYPSKAAAVFTVNGTFNVTGTFGGEIKSSNANATVKFTSATLSMSSVEGNSGSTSSTQAFAAGSFLFSGEFVTVATISASASLKNGDGTTTTPTASATYKYVNNVWVKQ